MTTDKREIRPTPRAWDAWLPAPPLRVYLVHHLPGWFILSMTAWVLVRWFDVPAWAGLILTVAWIVKDALLYPRMRPFYTSVPPDRILVDQAGVAVTPVAPHGMVRVRGELWQARIHVVDGRIDEGAAVRVREVRGLVLVVEPWPAQRPE